MSRIDVNQSTNSNLALNKPTAQSSIFAPERYGYDPYGACNGKRTGEFGFHTLNEDQPWWQIDLKGVYQLSEIRIYNRIPFKERACTLDVLLSQDALNWELCYSNDKHYNFGGIDGNPLLVDAHQCVARYVRLQLRESEYLHLDEVEVYGTPFERDSSDLQSNCDEITLAANFYSQSSIPSPATIVKMVISLRADGIGTRLMSILSARYICEYFNCNLCVTWPSIKSRYYSSNILQADSITEVFEGGNVFEDINVNILAEEELSKIYTKQLSSFKSGVKRKGCFLILNKSETEALSQYGFLTYDEPWAIIPFGTQHKQVSKRIKDYWKKVNWNREIVNSIRCFENRINDRPYAVLHIRRGDIIDKLLYDKIQVLHRDMEQILGRFLPISSAVKLILELDFKDIVVCSECDSCTQIVVDKVKRNNSSINFYTASEFTQSLSKTQAATFDLITMSAGAKIITSSSSSFSRCAEFSGSATRLRITTDWQSVAHELVEYLDSKDNEMTNERKSLVYIHISNKIQDKQLAAYYMNLSKQISSHTFARFGS